MIAYLVDVSNPALQLIATLVLIIIILCATQVDNNAACAAISGIILAACIIFALANFCIIVSRTL